MNIYQKLIEVRKAVPYLKKENKGHQYSYVSSSQVLSSIREKIDELGLLLIPKVLETNVMAETTENKDKYGNNKKTTTYFTELKMEFTWVNADKPDETIVCPWYGQGVDVAGEKGVGKALTYAEKYFLLKFFNVATDKDDPDAFQHANNSQSTTTNQKPKATAENTVEKAKQEPMTAEAWKKFWVSAKEMGYTREQVHKIANRDSLAGITKYEAAVLLADLRKRKEAEKAKIEGEKSA